MQRTFGSVNKKTIQVLFPTLKKLHSKFGQMYRESVSTFADLSVTLGAAPRHVQRVRFLAPEISRLFGDTVGASLVGSE